MPALRDHQVRPSKMIQAIGVLAREKRVQRDGQSSRSVQRGLPTMTKALAPAKRYV